MGCGIFTAFMRGTQDYILRFTEPAALASLHQTELNVS